MALNWKPHTELPLFDYPETLLLAYPAGPALGEIKCLGGIFLTHGDGSISHEVSGHAPGVPFFWIREDELLEDLPCAD